METIHYFDDFKWQRLEGFEPAIEQVILGDTLDQVAKTGVRTRFVRYSPGSNTRVTFLHDYDEEVYLMQGGQELLDGTAAEVLQRHAQGAYFVRPAGTPHGPFASEEGCVLFEIHSYP
jgi:hypothetical protein